MLVLVSGGTGFVGRALVRTLLGRGDEVVVLTRDPFEGQAIFEDEIAKSDRLQLKTWEPTEPGPWQEHLDAVDAVVHLAGEVAVGRRYTEKLKRRIRESRVRSAELLADAIAGATKRPRVFVSASGVGFYGIDAGAKPVDESAPAGDDFLAQVCVAWEQAAARAKESGVRVVCPRFGVVLGRGGGALETMKKPFRYFFGGPQGTGQQVVSWIHLDDVVRIVLLCLDDASLEGPVNATAPQAATNEQVAIALGHALGRPSWFRVPEVAVRLALGDEGAEPVLGGQRAVPQKLLGRGFEWKYTDLRRAMRAGVGKPTKG